MKLNFMGNYNNMTTLIVPCAGISKRYPDMKPKWLLTHPTGNLMIQQAVSKLLDNNKFDKVIFTILQEHCSDHEADIILKQCFSDINIEIFILDKLTNGPAETIYKTIKNLNIKDSLVIKDCDNSIDFNIANNKNFICGVNLKKYQKISNISGKSFIEINRNNKIIDIVEKRIISDNICVGSYGFQDCNNFIDIYENIYKNINTEIFISHIISNLIKQKNIIFDYIEANEYNDWGTYDEWKYMQKRHQTIFCDIDGVIFKNTGKYGSKNWQNYNVPILENIKILNNLILNGATLILTTSRPENLRHLTINQLSKANIKFSKLIMDLPHSCRIIINDFNKTNPFPSAKAISIPRDSELKNYID
jgi:hypothetical protein